MDLSRNTTQENASRVLLVDDDALSSRSLERALVNFLPNIEFVKTETAQEAIFAIENYFPAVAVVDLTLDLLVGTESGLNLISKIARLDSTTRIIVLTGHNAEEFGNAALKRGAFSYLQKPPNIEHLAALILDGINVCEIKRSYKDLVKTPDNLALKLNLRTKNTKMLKCLELAAFAASNNQPVLILGETGTGKGVLAKAIHKASERRNKPFIRIQPTYSGNDLISSELFGHTKGAFTGAMNERKGLIELANSGSLFIDEIDQLPEETQVILLNVLQEKKFRRLGANTELESNFRLISATNCKKDSLISKDALRSDFYHRISHIIIELPTLQERSEDIPELANGFAEKIIEKENLNIQGLSIQAINKLSMINFSGNIRQLQSVVENACFKASYLEKEFVDDNEIQTDQNFSSNDILEKNNFHLQIQKLESELVSQALKNSDNNQTKAAKLLGLDRSSFRRILSRK
jgi:two-component system, NtrC family, response regulator AtoC